MATIQNKNGSTSPLAAGSTSERKRAIREEAYRDALTNLRLEGLEMDEDARGIFQRHIDGEISFERFRVAIDDLNERKFGPASQSGKV
jgi:hypothetical protein